MPRNDPSADSFDLEAALDELARSGPSTAAFARQRGVAAWKLYAGLSRRRKRRLAGGRRWWQARRRIALRVVDTSRELVLPEQVRVGGRAVGARGIDRSHAAVAIGEQSHGLKAADQRLDTEAGGVKPKPLPP